VTKFETAYVYAATVLSVHDGDTFLARIDEGFGNFTEKPVRLAGCNAIELDDPGGKEAREHLLKLLPVGSLCLIRSWVWDKWRNRIDAMVLTTPTLNWTVTESMIRDGYAARWDGKGKPPVPPWPIPPKPKPTLPIAG
jgi:Micrococcal nuclease (thermonuclease) homologs